MIANQAEYAVSRMSSVLGVSCSGFNASLTRRPSARSLEDDGLRKKIVGVYDASRQTYGVPRIHAELADAGIHVGRKRVERLTRQAGSEGVRRRKGTQTTIRDDRVRPACDLVDRSFFAETPNQLWGADITYIRTWAGFVYLAVVLDASSRKIVGLFSVIAKQSPVRQRDR